METINATQSSFHSILNEPKEATLQEPTPTPTPAFDLNALLLTALAPVVKHMMAPLLARVDVLERSLVVADKATQGNETELFSRVALLEDKLDNIKDASDERIKEIAEEVAEQAISEHKYEYDHDEYDSIVSGIEEQVNDAINDLDLEDKLRDALRGMTFDITARY